MGNLPVVNTTINLFGVNQSITVSSGGIIMINVIVLILKTK